MDPVVQRLLEGLKSGKRAALAESITLVESVHPRKKALAQVLMAHVLEFNKKKVKHSLKKTTSFRIGNHHDHGISLSQLHNDNKLNASCLTGQCNMPELSHCGLVMPYCDIDLGQHWLR